MVSLEKEVINQMFYLVFRQNTNEEKSNLHVKIIKVAINSAPFLRKDKLI